MTDARSRWTRLLRRPTGRGALIGIACGLASWLIALLPVSRTLEEWCQDASFVDRGPRETSAKVILIALDDRSLQDYPKPLSFISPDLARIVGYLHARGAAAIGLDMLVPETLDSYPGLGGEDLGLAAATAGNVVLPAVRTDDNRLQKPLRVWQTGSPLGMVNMDEDDDHFLRRQRLADREGDRVYYQFAVAVLKAAGQVDDARPDGRLRVAGRVVPVDGRTPLRINYAGPTGTIPRVSFRDALAAADGGPTPRLEGAGGPADFEGAIVIVGATARSRGDLHASPYSNGTWSALFGTEPGLMPGSEVHANIAATLLDGAFITTPWWLSSLPQVLLLGAALGIAFARLTLTQGFLLAAFHHFFWKVACVLFFQAGHWRVEMVAMLLTGATCYAATFALRWSLLRKMFGAVKSEAIARALEDDPDHLRLKGEVREVTILFSDIRSFTTFSEGHSPREVVALLNAYFGAVVPILEEHGGTVDKYIGDGIMVIFGAPVARPDHAARAVRAAVEMVARVHELADRWAALGWPGMRIGVGVHTGPAVVGTIGSPRRLDYTAIGDTVNASARIESENKPLGAEVLISDRTYAAVPVEERARLGCVATPEFVSVKGKDESLALHRVHVGDRPPATVG